MNLLPGLGVDGRKPLCEQIRRIGVVLRDFQLPISDDGRTLLDLNRRLLSRRTDRRRRTRQRRNWARGWNRRLIGGGRRRRLWILDRIGRTAQNTRQGKDTHGDGKNCNDEEDPSPDRDTAARPLDRVAAIPTTLPTLRVVLGRNVVPCPAR